MEREALKRLLGRVRDGKATIGEAMERLRHGPVSDLGFATVDLHRALRRGFPEVIYGAGKTVEQIGTIMRSLHSAGQTVLVTRVGPEVHRALVRVFPRLEHHPEARAVMLPSGRRRPGRPGIVVMSAGTSDLPVAEEAALTATVMGNDVRKVYDVGVAGLHRLMAHREAMLSARVIVVVAGMEGALPSVVAGLVDCPVIGVPTSTGYGTGAGGWAALMAMLNSCASGVAVVNIDNGFGAGCLAALINRGRAPRATKK
jgi:NCAIR mutase (PurE)-related protein